MIFGKTKLEMKVGVFVFIGLVILVFFVLSIGNFKTWTAGYRVNFIFNFINGVKLGAPVRFSGVDVGEVKEIDFIKSEGKKDQVKISCMIRKQIRIPADSKIWVNTLGLLGEKYIEVMPGSETSKFLARNQSLTGEDPIPMQEVGRLLKDIGTKLDEGITRINNKEGTIGKLLFDDTIYNDLEALVKDIRRYPWKLLHKTKEIPENDQQKDKNNFR